MNHRCQHENAVREHEVEERLKHAVNEDAFLAFVGDGNREGDMNHRGRRVESVNEKPRHLQRRASAAPVLRVHGHL